MRSAAYLLALWVAAGAICLGDVPSPASRYAAWFAAAAAACRIGLVAWSRFDRIRSRRFFA